MKLFYAFNNIVCEDDSLIFFYSQYYFVLAREKAAIRAVQCKLLIYVSSHNVCIKTDISPLLRRFLNIFFRTWFSPESVQVPPVWDSTLRRLLSCRGRPEMSLVAAPPWPPIRSCNSSSWARSISCRDYGFQQCYDYMSLDGMSRISSSLQGPLRQQFLLCLCSRGCTDHFCWDPLGLYYSWYNM